MSHPVWYTRRMKNMKNKMKTYNVEFTTAFAGSRYINIGAVVAAWTMAMAAMRMTHGMTPMSTQTGRPVDNFSLTAWAGPRSYSQCKLIL